MFNKTGAHVNTRADWNIRQFNYNNEAEKNKNMMGPNKNLKLANLFVWTQVLDASPGSWLFGGR